MDVLRKYLNKSGNDGSNKNQDWKCTNCGHNNDKTHVICGGCFIEKELITESKQENDNSNQNNDEEEDFEEISNYLGFYQPKNGTCGFVAGLHAILLYKMWDQVINQSIEQMMTGPVKPKFDFKHLMISSIAHALMTCADSAAVPMEYDPNEAVNKKKQDSKPKSWKCASCQTDNASANIICKNCYIEPP